MPFELWLASVGVAFAIGMLSGHAVGYVKAELVAKRRYARFSKTINNL